MNWRATLLAMLFATGLTLSMVPRASADPPPWAGKWKHHHQKHDRDRGYYWRDGNHNDYWRRDRDDRYAWRYRRYDHDRDDGYYRRGRSWYGPYSWNDRYYRGW